jgi:4-amino-4-deoxychorismate lyase
MLECLVDGEISDYVPVTDRGLNFGEGLSETLLIRSGQPRFWQGHMDRLADGCERLSLPLPPQSVLLREVQTVSAGQGDCLVKIVLTGGASGPTYRRSETVRCRRIVCAYPLPEMGGQPETTGVQARICDLRLAVQPVLSGLGHLNRLERVMARSEWRDETVQEGILLDPEDHVISGISSNIFLVFSDRLLTPRLDRCGIRGVMRAAILSAFRPRCEQRRIMLDMLPDAEEVFVCSTVRNIWPVTRIGHWEYPVGRVTREVQEWLAGQ